ncbi:addiction module toxin, HicA family [Candidatus Nomurabacteria bacterium RIFCSPLOWO2_02_FULL_42_17]|uniref:Addiction module toxin, HicA family n=2 Tax=Candidatus Nomuraibacteriota TaxID=1752729 RepID=A0A1F6WIN3_9BACT|nr:MAG: hypothetical protein UV08_C0011G0005 [Parcubacteria group bacterium GW2011_GWA2_42_18]OGI81749.1 MAG: addiction module toxin, HicA family [Candidatus Nomurabacteria bacterium RIFCSPHIGHO2_02_FULL_42_24]OGI97272.1 MAG: addiction module toxin, HicA family [Candidatus Nomurabacteria bacterium RIFCSPLOWO2_02_FULL_42_17]
MKRIELMRHLREHDCFLIREGTKHSVIFNVHNGKSSTVPRHNEINSNLGKKICRDLGILEIKKK